jgi:hypothetical protein
MGDGQRGRALGCGMSGFEGGALRRAAGRMEMVRDVEPRGTVGESRG